MIVSPERTNRRRLAEAASAMKMSLTESGNSSKYAGN